MSLPNILLNRSGLCNVLVCCSAGALLAGCGVESEANPSAAAKSEASVKPDSKASKARAKGLICKQSMGEYDRTTWIGNINYEGRSTMASRSTVHVEDKPTVLLHDNGKSVTSYFLHEDATETPRGIVADNASFDGDVKDYLSSMKFMFGQCSAWVVEPDFLSPVPASSTSLISDTKRNDASNIKDLKSNKSGQTYLETLVESNVVRCGFKQTLKIKDSNKLALWAGAEQPYLFIKHLGKATSDLTDDAMHSKTMFYVTNSSDSVSKGDKPAYVGITQNVLFNEKGRYQWVENADETMAKIKAMGSLEKGKSLAKLEKDFTPLFIDNRMLRYQMRDEERANFVYSFDVWADNIKATNYPIERLKKCEIPQSEKMVKPPKLDYLTYDKVWQKYENRAGAELDRRKASGNEFTSYVNLTRFPFKIDGTGHPAFAPKNLSNTKSK